MFSLYLLLIFVGVSSVFGEFCDVQQCKGIEHYAILGCTPIFENDGQCCPKKFDCQGAKNLHREGECSFRGKNYKKNEKIESDNECMVSCICSGDRISCAFVDCPKIEGCNSYKHSLDQCCPSNDCVDETENGNTCEFEGKTYYEGQRMYPKNSCTVCICGKGFNATLTPPFCKKVGCGITDNYLQSGCAPNYVRGNCCPFGSECPDGNERVEGEISAKSWDPQCEFGKVKLNIGQKVAGTNCECLVPPLVTCFVN